MEDDIKNNPAIIFPEIIGTTIVAIASPFYLYKLFENGYYLISGIGIIIWSVGIYFTIYALREKNYFIALLPMLMILGCGFLIHSFIGDI